MDRNEELKSISTISSISDDELLVRLPEILKQSRRVESVLVVHIAEVDARGIYVRKASSSMFAYCTDVLHLSEGEAYLRIGAARASRRYPVLLTMLKEGRLHLTAIGKLAPHLTDDNVDELLSRATHKTKKQILQLIAEIAPQPDIAPSMRKVPQKAATTRPAEASQPSDVLRPDAVGGNTTALAQNSPVHPANPAPQSPAPPSVVEPLAPARYKVQFTASGELHDKLERLAALMPGVDLASMVEAAVTEKLERVEAKRLGKVQKPRKKLEEADTSPGVRGISAPVKRVVWERDEGQCTYVSADGRRCPERSGLEFHHDDPYGFGGDRSAGNIRLLCCAHNRYMAEMDYGIETMKRYRRSADGVREPAPSFQLRPD